MRTSSKTSIAIVGAGLWGLVYLHVLKRRHPDSLIILFEESKELLGNKTWSCHWSDIPEHLREDLRSLEPYQWSKQQVRFPRFCREIPEGYLSFSARELAQRVQNQWPESINLGKIPTDQEITKFDLVIDTRPTRKENAFSGYQKFVGIEWECSEPHGLSVPVIMDASVEQIDGFRFFYVLPLSNNRLFIEDTRYSDSEEIDEESFVAEIHKYKSKYSLVGAKEVYREKAALPIPHYLLSTHADLAYGFKLGAGNGFFHPVTGYSFPQMLSSLSAVDLALSKGADPKSALDAWMDAFRRRTRPYYFLNRLLFLAAAPHERLRIFQRFYGLDIGLIRRFYALQMGWRDWLTLFMGKAPIKIRKALEVSWKGGL